MTLKEHKKHASLMKPDTGNFGRNEFAIVGAPCINIKLLANDVIKALSPKFNCAYADASHNDEIVSMPGRLAAGAVLEYTDHQNHHEFSYASKLAKPSFKQQFSSADLILVNGNHQQAKAQVVIIHPNKAASLQKRIDQLDNVQMILLAENADDVFDFIKEAIPLWENIPTYRLNETDKIIAFFENKAHFAIAPLSGLVLAGGKSQRMGHDKASYKWHGKEQQYYLADMMKTWCDDVFISCRDDQRSSIDAAYPVLEDTFTGLGPYGALLSAFRQNPNSAWLVVACDLPLLDTATLAYLVKNRASNAVATAFNNPEQGFPEPLITIWEPKAYSQLLLYLAEGYSCPRKVLINSEINLINAPEADALTNVNTPEELQQVQARLYPAKA